MNINDLEKLTLKELQVLAREAGLSSVSRKRKNELVAELLKIKSQQENSFEVEGTLEVLSEGFGFVRLSPDYSLAAEDVYISPTQIRRFDLRTGDLVKGKARPPKAGEKYYALLRIEEVNDLDPELCRQRPYFDNLTPVYPSSRVFLERENLPTIATRALDLIVPLGKGQRGLIVSPPKAGKTMLLIDIANSISANYPEIELFILLIDERPEEVTDIKNSVKAKVVSSTFDELPENHIRIADMVLERSKRLVEQKKDVAILLDSLTRLARANNLVIPPSGRTLSGGVDPTALYKPKRFFGAARNVKEGGSLTILATSLVETGSRMDEVIFEEFKGTGNMEIILDRRLAERRLFPALDIKRSGTRREELLFTPQELEFNWNFRRLIQNLTNAEAVEMLFEAIRKTKSNKDLLRATPDLFPYKEATL